MAPGDDDFTLIRKSLRDLDSIHRRTAQLEKQNPDLNFVHAALLDFKWALAEAAKRIGRGNDLLNTIRGTKDCVTEARRRGIPVRVFTETGEVT